MKRLWALLIITAASLLASTEDAQIPVPQFVDVTATSGIHFEHICGAPFEKNYIFEAKGGGLAAFDYNNDGLMDLLLVQGSTLERVEERRQPSLRPIREPGKLEIRGCHREGGHHREGLGNGRRDRGLRQ